MADEVRRRLVHVAGSFVPLLYLLDPESGPVLNPPPVLGQDATALGLGWAEVQALLLAGSLAALVLEALRLSGRVQWRVYDDLTREYEQEYLAGYALYTFGMAAAALLFPPMPAVAAMLMLTVGDPISGLLGSGTVEKPAWVLAAMFGVCLLVAAPFVPPAVAVLGAAVAALADGAKPVVATYVIDDNLTIPLGAGAAMTLALAVL